MISTTIKTTEVAKQVRVELYAKFPKTKFSVKSKFFSGGSSVDIKWENGPAESQVRAVVGHFRGADFDGMQDCMVPNGRLYANDFIDFNRLITEEHYMAEAKWAIGYYHGLANLSLELDRDNHNLLKFGVWTLRQLAWLTLKDKVLPCTTGKP